MKVFDLCCGEGHRFEGWFASEPDFLAQQSAGLVVCPICESVTVVRRPSAPRLNLGASPSVNKDSSQALAAQSVGDVPSSSELPGRLLRALQHLVSQAEDVGDAFATQARAMHEGEMPAAAIRGRASSDEVRSLLEDGIEVLPLPDVPLLKQTLQ